MDRVLKAKRKTSPFAARPIKEYIVQEKHPRSIDTRTSYNSFMENHVIMQKGGGWPKNGPMELYGGLIPLPKKKYDQLQELRRRVAVNLQRYYE